MKLELIDDMLPSGITDEGRKRVQEWLDATIDIINHQPCTCGKAGEGVICYKCNSRMRSDLLAFGVATVTHAEDSTAKYIRDNK